MSKNCLQLTDKIISPVGKLPFIIKCNFSCKSKNILYYMTCTICGQDYVGQINDFRKRMNNHKSDIRGTPTKDTILVEPITKHWQSCNDPHLQIRPIAIFSFYSLNYSLAARLQDNIRPTSPTKVATKRKLQQFTVSGWLIMNGGESGNEKRKL